MSLVDWIIVFFLTIGCGFIGVVTLAVYLVVRWWMRGLVEGHDEIARRQREPRVRTRVQQSPIETEIADALARDYPNRKPAQFI